MICYITQNAVLYYLMFKFNAKVTSTGINPPKESKIKKVFLTFFELINDWRAPQFFLFLLAKYFYKSSVTEREIAILINPSIRS